MAVNTYHSTSHAELSCSFLSKVFSVHWGLYFILCGLLTLSSEGSEWTVRLTGGKTPADGRVEVYIERYVTICAGTSWTLKNAAVVCRMNGYKYAIDAIRHTSAEDSSLTIWLSDVKCDGREFRLDQCSYTQGIQHNCPQTSVARVSCSNDVDPYADLPARLNGEFAHSGFGRLEVFYDNQWGTVCKEKFYAESAMVACQQMGYLKAHIVENSVSSGFNNSVPIWLTEVFCTNRDKNIGNCVRGLGIGNTYSSFLPCEHDQDVFLTCEGDIANKGQDPYPGDLRLVGGPDEFSGRLEIWQPLSLKEFEWRTICSENFTPRAASVACSELAGSPYGACEIHLTANGTDFGLPERGVFQDVLAPGCRYERGHLSDCDFLQTQIPQCDHSKDVGLRCYTPEGTCLPQGGDIQLIGGETELEGTVLVYSDGKYDTICDDDFDENAARVICTMLGYTGDPKVTKVEAFEQAYFGEGPGEPRFSKLHCKGYESSIMECNYETFSRCTHKEDAGVRCSIPVVKSDEPLGTMPVWKIVLVCAGLILAMATSSLIAYYIKATRDAIRNYKREHEEKKVTVGKALIFVPRRFIKLNFQRDPEEPTPIPEQPWQDPLVDEGNGSSGEGQSFSPEVVACPNYDAEGLDCGTQVIDYVPPPLGQRVIELVDGPITTYDPATGYILMEDAAGTPQPLTEDKLDSMFV